MLSLCVCSAARQPGGALSRRSALTSGFLAVAATLPAPCSAKFGDGCPECQQNKELETSPLIEELKRRTEANKEKNAAAVKENLAFTNGVVEEQVKMVRYQGKDDSLPVTRMMTRSQIKELEALGYKVECPSWGGACELNQVAASTPTPPSPPPPPVEQTPPPASADVALAPPPAPVDN